MRRNIFFSHMIEAILLLSCEEINNKVYKALTSVQSFSNLPMVLRGYL